jgi:cell division protein FtsB
MSQNWVQHALRDRPWRVQRQAVALAGLGVFIAIIMGALYLAQVSALSTTGRQLESLILERNQIEQTNEQLRAEIAELKSVPRLLERARQLGFVEAKREDEMFLVVDGYNPNRQPPAAPAQNATQPQTATYDETFTGWLQQQWDSFTSQLRSFSKREG